MKNAFIILIFSIVTISVFSSCAGGANKEEAKTEEAGHEEEGHAEGNMVMLTEGQLASIGIEMDSIRGKELANTIKANGVLEVPNQNKAFVTPLHNGVVKTLNVQPGTSVREGQAIATIVNPELLQMQQQLLQLNTEIALTETELRRQKELVEGNAAPLKRLQRVEAQLANQKTQRDAIRNQLRGYGAAENFSSSIVIKAPISGTISKVIAQLGSNVDVTSPIAEIVNNSQLHLDLFVYEKDLPKLQANQVIHFTLTNNPGKEYDAKIYSIGTAFQSESKTIPIHSRVIGDKSGLIDGMSITAIVSLDKSTVPAVPNDAIVTYQGQDYIFVKTDQRPEEEHQDESADKKESHEKGKEAQEEEGIFFERIPVAKGNSDVGYTAITLLKEIPAGSKVVVKGAFFILAKMTNSGEEGHGH